jgi:hypothetical protein
MHITNAPVLLITLTSQGLTLHSYSRQGLRSVATLFAVPQPAQTCSGTSHRACPTHTHTHCSPHILTHSRPHATILLSKTTRASAFRRNQPTLSPPATSKPTQSLSPAARPISDAALQQRNIKLARARGANATGQLPHSKCRGRCRCRCGGEQGARTATTTHHTHMAGFRCGGCAFGENPACLPTTVHS